MHKFCTYKLATTMHVGIAEIVVQETQGSKTSCMHIVYNCQDPKLAASSSQHTQLELSANIFLQTR